MALIRGWALIRINTVLSERRYSSTKLRMYGGGASLSPPPLTQTHAHSTTTTTTNVYKRLLNFATLRSYIFVSFQQITFKPGNFINLKALFSVVSTDFP